MGRAKMLGKQSGYMLEVKRVEEEVAGSLWVSMVVVLLLSGSGMALGIALGMGIY